MQSTYASASVRYRGRQSAPIAISDLTVPINWRCNTNNPDAILTPVHLGPQPQHKGRTEGERTDRWWIRPLLIATGLALFIGYSTWATFQNAHYFATPYLSPFYSPCISQNCSYHSFTILGSWWKLSPALLVVPIPLGFRMSCYYFRKAYYRSFWLSPPACGIADRHNRYTGESRLPLLLQNVHRYFFYSAVLLALFDTWDALQAFNFNGHIGIGVGTIVMLIDAALLWSYTLGCHSCRHLCGGTLRRFSPNPIRYRVWLKVSALNRKHALLGWVSLYWVGFTDLYVRLVATGAIHDLRLF